MCEGVEVSRSRTYLKIQKEFPEIGAVFAEGIDERCGWRHRRRVIISGILIIVLPILIIIMNE